MECSLLTTIGAKRADTLIYLFTGLLPCPALYGLFAALAKMPKYTIQYRTMSWFPPKAGTCISCITDKHNEVLDQEKTNAWKPDCSRRRQPRILGYKHRYGGEMERFDVSVPLKQIKTKFSRDITANQIQHRRVFFKKYAGFLILLWHWRLFIIDLCVFW